MALLRLPGTPCRILCAGTFAAGGFINLRATTNQHDRFPRGLLSVCHRALSGSVTSVGSNGCRIMHSPPGLQVSSLLEETAQGCEEHIRWARGGGLVHSTAKVHPSVVVEPSAVVQSGAIVGADSVIGAGSVVGPGVKVGSSTTLGPLVSLQHCTVGEHCILHTGVRIGADGFGFFVNEVGEVVKKPQLLSVLIGNSVEIGANSCVDRGSWRDTVIGDNCKLDNLVQIGHNVELGRCCILCGQSAVGGSATLGEYVVLGGQVGVADHVSVCAKVRFGAKSGVLGNITEPGDYAGVPAVPAREWRKLAVLQRRMGRSKRGDAAATGGR